MIGSRFARQRTVRRRLMMILMVTSCGALLLACTSFAVHSHLRFRREVRSNLEVLARMVADHTRVAFEQGDQRLAESMLAGLSANSHLMAAGLYGPDGKLNATFFRDRSARGLLPERDATRMASSQFRSDTIRVHQPVLSGRSHLGSVVMISDQGLVMDHLWSFTLSLPAVLLAAAGVAFLLSRRLQRLVSQPIDELSQVAREVSRDKDYSRRVDPAGASVETDALAHSFNDMLDTIQRHERELTASRDEAQQASHARAEFLANVSHELRTPMNGVIGLTDLLIQSPLSDQQREYARIIQNSGHTLLHLINDVLDLSKVEAGKLELEEIDFDLREAFEHPLALLAGAAHDKGLDLGLRIEHDVPRLLRGDPVRLQQVVTNLLSNAVKFTDRGEVFVHVRRSPDDTAGPDALRLAVEVRDTGIGVADEVRERIFETFMQADGSTTRRFGGTGLGLALCKRLVGRMRGDITVDSRPGRGSTFRFTCVLGARGGGSVAGVSAEFTGLRGRCALVVSESAREREILAHHLELVGVACQDLAPDQWHLLPAEARAGDLYDFALMSERAIARVERHEVRETDPLFPVLAVTTVGATVPADVLAGFRVHAQLPRPISQRQLLKCLRELPFVRHAPPSRAVADTAGLLEVPESGKARVLIAEDHPVNQRVVGEMLKRLGHPYDVVETGAAALRAVADTDRYELILMDCQMPDMDGLEATRRIRELPGGARLPIVALTAGAGDSDRDQALAAGMDDYLAKPLFLDDLRDVLERWLGRATPV